MAKTPLVYPKMPGSAAAPLERCIAFEKCDGTNLHWVWDRELQWHAFGTRRDRFDCDERGIAEFESAHPELQHAARVFLNQLAEPLASVFAQRDLDNNPQFIAFTEFLGDNSFAGRHRHTDPKRLVLLDIETDSGFVAPDTFVEHYGELPIPRIVYRGKLTGKFIEDVREGRYQVGEGVVCKGGTGASVWRVKIKTNAYMQRLKEAWGSDWENYWE